MKKKGLRSSARQGGHNLSADQTRFPDPGDDHPSLAFINQFNGLGKRFPNFLDQAEDALRFDPEHLSGLLYGNILRQWAVLSVKML